MPVKDSEEAGVDEEGSSGLKICISSSVKNQSCRSDFLCLCSKVDLDVPRSKKYTLVLSPRQYSPGWRSLLALNRSCVMSL